LDEAHRSHLDIAFDPINLPKDQFIFPWQAWKLCKSGAADPADFDHGSLNTSGLTALPKSCG
jgi:hypothetical protein